MATFTEPSLHVKEPRIVEIYIVTVRPFEVRFPYTTFSLRKRVAWS